MKRLPENELAKLLSVAEAFRRENPDLGQSGYVTIFEDKATGWKRTLERVNTEAPGAYAVSSDGRVYLACGGDSRHGAAEYQKVGSTTG